ncbi:TRAP-type C4-dicarboxylate transport system, small permease component [Celeribacter indicus]|nr:TRAP-type C4-dicarboxylate transport system, small permease component [Celeribacter indicus]
MDRIAKSDLAPPERPDTEDVPTERLLSLTQGLSRTLALAGGFLILGAGALVAVEIFARKVLGGSTGIADELTAYALAIGSTMAFPYCLVERGHIRVDSVVRFLPRPLRTALDLLALASITGFFAVVAFHAAETALVSFERGARAVTLLQTPLFIPQGIWALAYVIFVLTGIAIFLVAVSRLIRRDPKGVKSLIGPRSGKDEAEAHL